jgi:hypothetical protein
MATIKNKAADKIVEQVTDETTSDKKDVVVSENKTSTVKVGNANDFSDVVSQNVKFLVEYAKGFTGEKQMEEGSLHDVHISTANYFIEKGMGKIVK